MCLCNYVRTLMEYNSVVWSPDLKRDTDAIEKVQRRFTKRLAGLKKPSYGQRLKLVNLPSLELRRLHTDLLCCYKIVFGVVDLMCDGFFKLCQWTVTRGYMYKLYKPSSTSSARSRFFACRTSCVVRWPPQYAPAPADRRPTCLQI